MTKGNKLCTCTVKSGYNKHGYSEHTIITSICFGPVKVIAFDITSLIANNGYNEQI